MALKKKTGKFSFTFNNTIISVIQGHAISPTWPSPTSLSLSCSFPDGNHGWHHHDHDPPGTRWWLLTVYPCPSVSRFPGQLATLWPGYNPHDGDALVRIGILMNHCRQVPEQVCHPKPVTECHPVARKVPRKVCIMTRWRWRWQESFWGISSFNFLRCAPQLLFLFIPTVLTIQSLSTENREVFSMKLWVAALFISSPLCLA